MSRRTKQEFVVVNLLILMVLFTTTCLWAGDISNAPVIVIPEKVFDFKEVKEGTVLEHIFKVYNKGNKVLNIKRVKPG